MASTMHVARSGDTIKLETGVPQVFALKYISGKNLGDSSYPPYLPRVMFTLVDERWWFLGADEASEVEHGLLDLEIKPCEFIRVTQIKHGGRGGGYSIRVEREDDGGAEPAGPASRRPQREDPRTEALLQKSIDMARTQGPAAFITPPGRETRRAAPVRTESSPRATSAKENTNPGTQSNAGSTVQQSNAMPVRTGVFAKLLAGALCASIDAYQISASYAESKGVAFEFQTEDIRCSATSLLIEYFNRQKGGRS